MNRYEEPIATISTADCFYSTTRKILSIPLRNVSFEGRSRFPSRIHVESHHTGRVVLFTQVQFGHPLFDEDGWDGEQMVYVPAQSEMTTKAQSLAVYCD